MEPINRTVLKENAKIALKNNFWMIMIVAFVGGILGVGFSGLTVGQIGGLGSGFRAVFNRNFSGKVFERIQDELDARMPGSDFDLDIDTDESVREQFDDLLRALRGSLSVSDEELMGGILIGAGIVLMIAMLVYFICVCIWFLIGSFLSAPVTVGYYRFFMKNRKNESNFKDMFAVFSKENYMKVVGVLFSTNIRVWAWSLLFYFPGVVKAYQYYFVPYIMAENPNISKERARELSTEMTNGHKWEIFVLDLSFLGWVLVFCLEEILLVLISCGILYIPGNFLRFPLIGYRMTTFAELYEERREYALMTGMAADDELIGF